MKLPDEPSPAMVARDPVRLDKPAVLPDAVLHALIRAANWARALTECSFASPRMRNPRRRREFDEGDGARSACLGQSRVPAKVEVGAMLETPSLAFAPDLFFQEVDFLSIGGNDLKQFFFAADRENERVRKRYDTLNLSFLTLIEQIARRCDAAGTPLSFCGEDAGRPIEAVCFAALGVRMLSMRPASMGPVKHLLRRVNLDDLRDVIEAARQRGDQSVRGAVSDWLRGQT